MCKARRCDLWGRQCDWIWSAGDELFSFGRQSGHHDFKLSFYFYLFFHFLRYMTKWMNVNRPFPSSLVPLFQSESKCETILMKMTLICKRMKLHAQLIFIWKISHLDSFWNRGTRELGNGLFSWQLRNLKKNYFNIKA